MTFQEKAQQISRVAESTGIIYLIRTMPATPDHNSSIYRVGTIAAAAAATAAR